MTIYREKIFEYLIIFFTFLSLFFWTNEQLGKYLRFSYLICLFFILFNIHSFSKIIQNIKSYIYLFVFFVISFAFVFYKKIPFDSTNYLISLLIIILTFLYIQNFYKIINKYLDTLVKVYIVLFLVTFFLLALLNNFELTTTFNCFYGETKKYITKFYGENSHVSLIALPISLYGFYIKKFNLSFLLLLILFLFLSSLTLIVSFIFFLFIYLIYLTIEKKFSYRDLTLVIFLTISIMSLSNKNCSDRITDLTKNIPLISENVFISKDETLKQKPLVKDKLIIEIENRCLSNNDEEIVNICHHNLSAQVFIFHFLIMTYSLMDYPLGVGLNNYYYSKIKYQEKTRNSIIFDESVYVLNKKDGSSLLMKIVTEFGLNVLIFIYLLIYLILKKKISNLQILFLVLGLFSHVIRGVGYFNGGCIFYLLFIYYLSFRNLSK